MAVWRGWLKGGSYLTERALVRKDAHPKHSGSLGLDAMGDGIKPRLYFASGTPPVATPLSAGRVRYHTTLQKHQRFVRFDAQRTTPARCLPASCCYGNSVSALRRNVVQPLAANAAEARPWLWAIQDCRARTLRVLKEITQDELDADFGADDSIATRLYHIALIETDYLCIDVLGANEYLPELKAVLPLPDRDKSGRLSAVTGETPRQHLDRLAMIRRELIGHFSRMTARQFHHARPLPEWGYEISPAWTLHHLMQHEAEHRGDIAASLTQLRRQG